MPLCSGVLALALAMMPPAADMSCPATTSNVQLGELAAAKCCRVCRKGKACGNGCIKAGSRCTKDAGCACNASDTS
jgi:hypothetical protein